MRMFVSASVEEGGRVCVDTPTKTRASLRASKDLMLLPCLRPKLSRQYTRCRCRCSGAGAAAPPRPLGELSRCRSGERAVCAQQGHGCAGAGVTGGRRVNAHSAACRSRRLSSTRPVQHVGPAMVTVLQRARSGQTGQTGRRRLTCCAQLAGPGPRRVGLPVPVDVSRSMQLVRTYR